MNRAEKKTKKTQYKGRAPCCNCKERHEGCHGHCQKYADFQKFNYNRLQLKNYETAAREVAINSVLRNRRNGGAK